jgi:hypothetical protein
MTAATNSVRISFQTVRPSRIEATRPAGAKSCGEMVASAEGETKLPVMLTMVEISRQVTRVGGPGFFHFLFLSQVTNQEAMTRKEYG